MFKDHYYELRIVQDIIKKILKNGSTNIRADLS